MKRVPAPTDEWCVYILECADGSLYTGIARDLEARIATHNAGSGGKYTRSRLPVRLVYCEAARDRATASQREYSIKQLTRLQKQRLLDAC